MDAQDVLDRGLAALGLDGGGVCLVKPGGAGPVEELDFLPQSVPGGAVPVPVDDERLGSTVKWKDS